MRNVFILLVFLLFNTCKKDSNSCSFTFSGITFVDQAGELTGQCAGSDVDWTFSESWNSCELKLFNKINPDSLYYLNDSLKTPNILVYPIPFKDNFVIHINSLTSDTSLLTIKVIDKNMNIVFSLSELVSGQMAFSINANTIGFGYDKIYRMYYSLSYKSNINRYKGHGDIVRALEYPSSGLFNDYCHKISD